MRTESRMQQKIALVKHRSRQTGIADRYGKFNITVYCYLTVSYFNLINFDLTF